MLFELIKNMPKENYLYLSDTKNLPFGSKTERELSIIARKNIEKLNEYNPKAIVIGCNTLSVVLNKELQKFSSAPVFTVFPPVKDYPNKKVCLLVTPMTAEYLQTPKNIDVYALTDMASRVELGLRTTKDATLIQMPDIIKKIRGKYEVVILGCTHYSLIKNEFKKHLKPRIITDGCLNTVNKVKNYINYQQNAEDNMFGSVVFIGGNKINNKIIFEKYCKNFLKNY